MRHTTSLKKIFPIVLTVFSFASSGFSQDSDSFSPLFNGKNLDGWTVVNCATDAWTVKNNTIVCSGFPMGFLRSNKQYENFILQYEWCVNDNYGNSGLFVYADALPSCGVPFPRSIEIQMNNQSGGEIFPIHGAKMVPYKPHPQNWMRSIPFENRLKPAGEWNTFRLESKNGSLVLTVNGKTTNYAHYCNPRMGYICLESEGGKKVLFRNIKIRELPSTVPHPSEIAKEDQGYVPLFGDPNLVHWNPVQNSRWKTENWVVYYLGGEDGKEKPQAISTKKEYGDFSLILDWRFPSKPSFSESPVIWEDGTEAIDENGNVLGISYLNAGQSYIGLRGDEKCRVNLWSWPIGSGGMFSFFMDQSLPPEIRENFVPVVYSDNHIGEWNRLELTLIGDRVSTKVNAQLVISNTTIPNLPKRGPITIHHEGEIVLFTNIFVKEL